KKDTPPHEHIFTKISNIDVDKLSNDDPLCIGVIDLSSDKYNIPESDYESLVVPTYFIPEVSALAVNNTSILLEKREVCANPGCYGWIWKDCSYKDLYATINAIDASDYQALSDNLASMFAPDIDRKITSEDQVDSLTDAWYHANSAIFNDKGQCVKEYMLTWICDKYQKKSSLEALKKLLDRLPSILKELIPKEPVTAWVVKQALRLAIKKDISLTENLLNSVADIVGMSDVAFLYNVGNC
ncbi:14980_t:CDS:2, partial [Funneliformis caledonium]